MVAWPPAPRTDDIGDFIEIAESLEHVSAGDRQVSIIRVLLRFDGHYQASILKERNRAIVAWVIREDLHVLLEASVSNDSQRSIVLPIRMVDDRWRCAPGIHALPFEQR